MFKKHALQVKVVKDSKETKEPTLMDRINAMSPEELEELNRKLMRQAAIHIGALIVVKVSVPIILAIIAKRLETKN